MLQDNRDECTAFHEIKMQIISGKMDLSSSKINKLDS